MYEWNENSQRERGGERRSLHARWAREWREKRKLNSIIDGNQDNEIFQLNETYSIKIQPKETRKKYELLFVFNTNLFP